VGRLGGYRGTPWFVAEPTAPYGGQPRLLDRLHEAIRVRHLSPRTEEAYRHGIKRYIFFHTHVLNRGPAGVRSPVDGL